MASDGKSYNCKVLRIVEMDNFDIKIAPIRDHMQKLQAKLCVVAMFGRIIRAGVRIIREIEAPRHQKFCDEAGCSGSSPG